MSTTTDPNDSRLGRGVDREQIEQHEVYLVLSAEERARGFVRPLRESYKHIGDRPEYPLRALTDQERVEHDGDGYVAYEEYPESRAPVVGRFWTQEALDRSDGCGAVTTMSREIAETYARNPHFYGATYCIKCRKHLPVNEFAWWPDGSKVGS